MNILKKSYAETLLRFAAHSHRYGNAIPKNSRTTPVHCSGVTASERIITEQIIPAGSSDELKIVAAPVDIFGVPIAKKNDGIAQPRIPIRIPYFQSPSASTPEVKYAGVKMQMRKSRAKERMQKLRVIGWTSTSTFPSRKMYIA